MNKKKKEDRFDRDTNIIKEHFEKTPDIMISIGLEKCGMINTLSTSGLTKTLKERNEFIKKIAEHLSKELMDSIYIEVLKDIKFIDDDYTEESKRINCETCYCDNMIMGEHMGNINYCKKYHHGEENICPERTYLS